MSFFSRVFSVFSSFMSFFSSSRDAGRDCRDRWDRLACNRDAGRDCRDRWNRLACSRDAGRDCRDRHEEPVRGVSAEPLFMIYIFMYI